MRGMTLDQMYDYLLENIGVSEETLQVVTCINGYSEETLEDILYAFTGYRSFEQFLECEDYTTYLMYYNDDCEDWEECE